MASTDFFSCSNWLGNLGCFSPSVCFCNFNMDIIELEAAKMIGAGLAAIALAGAGVGIGIIFGNYLSGAMRNPSAAQKQFPNLLLGFALAEATGLFGLVVALIILFAF